jgi:primosomal protein N'
MYIITVIPLTRSKLSPTLSYFTSTELPIGAVVSVPLRSKTIYAIIIAIRPAEDIRGEIKNAPFEIRKLGKVKATAFFPISFLDSCSVLADFYATTVGAVIDTLIAEVLLVNAHKIPPPLSLTPSTSSQQSGDTYAVQGDTIDRHSSWRSLIRQKFAQVQSVALYVPTIEDAERIFIILEKGIEGYIFVLHNDLSSKEIIDTWKSIAESTHPVVVIATGSFLLLPRSDIDTIIIEREHGRGWVHQRAPYIDIRHALEIYHRAEQRTVYLSDSLLRTETLYRLAEHDIYEGSPFKWRSISTAQETLVDMRVYRGADNNFRVISPELETLITRNKTESTHLFILTTRRGISPSTVCSDCETIVTCTQCSAPVVLHTSKDSGRNFFMCHACGERRSAAEMCTVCGGWRLTPLGIGIQRVEEEIRIKFPDIDIFKIDTDTTDTSEKSHAVYNDFIMRPGSVLLGTEMALTYLPDKIDHVAIVSLDSLFALPDFRIQEKIMYTLIRLRNSATQSIVIQTRRAEEKVFEYGLKGNLSDFYRATLEERRQCGTLIKLSIEGKKDPIAHQMAEIQKILEPCTIDIFPAFTASIRGNSIIHGLIKIEPHTWPNVTLMNKLRALPPSVKVKINPESLL